MTAQYRCRGADKRIDDVRDSGVNGIHYLEVSQSQTVLHVHFVKAAPALAEGNFRIDGGARVTGIRVTDVDPAQSDPLVLDVTVDVPGDYSIYTLRVVKEPGSLDAHPAMDPQLSAVDFSFKVDCESDFDCKPGCTCHPPAEEVPEINYLARDYATFRRLMLDRLALTLPQWQERNAADAGIALVELLAYAADQLAYQQDAIATEAYLGTARKRVSVRRHARLVDYLMHDGCNARAWVQVRVKDDAGVPTVAVDKGTPLFTRTADLPIVVTGDPVEIEIDGEWFETMHDAVLRKGYNEFDFYTWSATECCLPKGATHATLDKHWPDLRAGDVLVFKEIAGAETGMTADADPAHRHAVRLTSVSATTDPVTLLPITEIAWATADALPFPLCISEHFDERGDIRVSIALGNIVLADHGRSVLETLPVVPQPNVALALAPAESTSCTPVARTPAPPRYRPELQQGPLTHAAPFDLDAPAADAFLWTMRDVEPAIELTDDDELPWLPRRDLLGSSALAREFVVETEDDVAMLRFGDDTRGRRPDSGTTFAAGYRTGNGRAGNVGAESIAHIVLRADPGIESVSNPIAAHGGIDPEPIEDVRQKAPVAFRTNERAVTAGDYEVMAQRHPEVSRAAATIRWTGSWYTVYLTVDRAGGREVDEDFREEILAHIDRYRMAGVDVEVDAPRFVPLELELLVCVRPGYFRSDVERAVLRVLGSGPDGLFHPDRFTFGQSVFLSHVYAAVHGVAGVDSVTVKKFGRKGGVSAKSTGEIEIERLEIAQLESNPSFPERGAVKLTMGGGR